MGKEQFKDIKMTQGSAESQIIGLEAGCQQSFPKTRLWQAFLNVLLLTLAQEVASKLAPINSRGCTRSEDSMSYTMNSINWEIKQQKQDEIKEHSDIGSLTKESQPGAVKPLSSQPAGHCLRPMRLAQGDQTQSPELSNHFTKTWVRKVNSSGCRKRGKVIRGWESISEDIRQGHLGCLSTSKTDMTQLYFVTTEQKILKRENNIYVKTQYWHRTNGCKSVIYQPRLATSTRTCSSEGSLPSILHKKEPDFTAQEIQSCIPKLQYRQMLHLFLAPSRYLFLLLLK